MTKPQAETLLMNLTEAIQIAKAENMTVLDTLMHDLAPAVAPPAKPPAPIPAPDPAKHEHGKEDESERRRK